MRKEVRVVLCLLAVLCPKGEYSSNLEVNSKPDMPFSTLLSRLQNTL